jgi:DNA/RNA-binding protein KIN17
MTQNGDSEAPSDKATEPTEMPAPGPAAPAKVTMKMSLSSKPKKVFSAAKKNTLGGKKAFVAEQPKKMSEAERIIKKEMAKKRGPSGFGGPAQKKQRF